MNRVRTQIAIALLQVRFSRALLSRPMLVNQLRNVHVAVCEGVSIKQLHVFVVQYMHTHTHTRTTRCGRNN